MGGYLSKYNPQRIDGLGLSSPLKNGLTEAQDRESHDRVEQILVNLVTNYRYNPYVQLFVGDYFMGSRSAQLLKTYDSILENLVPWPEEDPTADSISAESLSEFHGKHEYGLRYFEFFKDELTEESEWNTVAAKFMPQVLWRLFTDDMIPLIQLGCAAEVDNPIVAMQALAMACTYETDENCLLSEVESSELSDDLELLLLSHGADPEQTPAAMARGVISVFKIKDNLTALKKLAAVTTRLIPRASSLVPTQALAELLLGKKEVIPKALHKAAIQALVYHISFDYYKKGMPEFLDPRDPEPGQGQNLMDFIGKQWDPLPKTTFIRALLWSDSFKDM